MSAMFKGKEIFKPLNTGFIDERVSCIREYVVNIFFYTKNGHTIMVDAGYNYEKLAEKMVPANMTLEVLLWYTTHRMLEIKTHGALEQYTHEQMTELDLR